MPARTIISGMGVETAGHPGLPPLVLLHGFLGAASDWEPVMQMLAPHHFCVAIDLPGHGRSVGLDDSACRLQGAADLVQEVLDKMKIGRCALAGYSLGGRLALMLALQHPARWSKLTLVSASPGLEDDRARATRASSDAALAARLESDSFAAFLTDWYQQPMFAALWENAPLREEVLRRRARNSPAELARALRGMGPGVQPPLWNALKELDAPVLLMAGERDGKYVALARQMEGLCKQGRLAIVPAAGHAVHLETPAAFSRCLLDFLADTPS